MRLKRFLSDAGALTLILALTTVGAVQFHLGRDVSVLPAYNTTAPSDLTGQPLVPRVTVVVDSVLPVQSATGIALDPAGNSVWVTEEIADTGRLVRVDLNSGAVTPLVTGLNQPGHLAVSGTLAFVAGNMSMPVALVRIDLNSGALITVSDDLGGGLSGVAVNPALTRAYVVNFGSGVLSRVEINPASSTFKQVTPITGGLSGPRDIVLDITGTVAYVTEQNTGRLVRADIDPASPGYGNITPIANGLGGPRGLALNRAGDRVYLAEEADRELSVVDVSVGPPYTVTTILSGQMLRDVALTSDERRAVVTDFHDGILVVDIDPASPDFGLVVQRLTPAPLDGARGLWINNSRTCAYVVSEFSGYLSRVEIDPSSPALGRTERLAAGLDIPVDVLVDASEQTAYVAREQGPSRGANVVSRIDLNTGQVLTVSDAAGQPVNLAFTPDRQAAYVVDLAQGKVYHVTLPTGALTTKLTGLDRPFGLGPAPDGVTAYIVTEPASPSFPPGDLIAANLTTGNWSIIANDIISGATSIVVNPSGTRAYYTQFGVETGCTGKLSGIDINPLSATYLNVTDILADLCGPHDLDVRADERQFYVALVGGRKLIRVDLLSMIYLPIVCKNP